MKDVVYAIIRYDCEASAMQVSRRSQSLNAEVGTVSKRVRKIAHSSDVDVQ